MPVEVPVEVGYHRKMPNLSVQLENEFMVKIPGNQSTHVKVGCCTGPSKCKKSKANSAQPVFWARVGLVFWAGHVLGCRPHVGLVQPKVGHCRTKVFQLGLRRNSESQTVHKHLNSKHAPFGNTHYGSHCLVDGALFRRLFTSPYNRTMVEINNISI